MQKLLLIILCLLITKPLQANQDAIDQLPAFVRQGMTEWHVPGMAVGVVTDSKILFQQGFGSTAVSGGAKIDPHTLFAIASTTKAMIAAGIMMLAAEDKLALDDLAVKQLPELQFGDSWLNSQITVRDLLTHRTGLASTDFWTFAQGMPLAEQISHLRMVKPAASLRSRFQYQNTMFELLGLIIERRSGEPWQEFIRKRVWQPVGMRETFATRGEIPPGMTHVLPYFFIDNKLTQADWDIDAMAADAAGSVWSSLVDMSRWVQFLLRGGVTEDGSRLLSEASIAEIFKPQMLISPADFYPTTQLTEPHWLSYGLAWFQQDFQGRMIDFHTGSLSGLVAMIGLDREAKQAVVVLGNRDHAEIRHAILWQVMDRRSLDTRRDWNADVLALYRGIQDRQQEQWQKTVSQRLSSTDPSLPLDRYTGTYTNAAYGDLKVALEGQALMLRSAKFYLPLSHWHLDTFLAERKDLDARFLLPFTINSEAEVQSLEVFGEVFQRLSQKAE